MLQWNWCLTPSEWGLSACRLLFVAWCLLLLLYGPPGRVAIKLALGFAALVYDSHQTATMSLFSTSASRKGYMLYAICYMLYAICYMLYSCRVCCCYCCCCRRLGCLHVPLALQATLHRRQDESPATFPFQDLSGSHGHEFIQA